MGEAKAREQRLKDMTRPEIKQLINETMEAWLERNLAGLIDGIVQERIGDFAELLVARGLLRSPAEAAERGNGSRIITP